MDHFLLSLLPIPTMSHGQWVTPRYLNLGYVKLDNVFKFHAAYLVTKGNESIFVTPIINAGVISESADAMDDSDLLDTHNRFALKPKKLIQEYQENKGDLLHNVNSLST